MRSWLDGFKIGFRAQLEHEAQALGVSVRTVKLVSLAFWLFVAGLMLFPLVARAQVAGLCGPGKACSVKSLETTGSSTTGSYSWNLKASGGVLCLDPLCGSRLVQSGGAYQFFNGGTSYMTINPGVAASTSMFLYGASLGSGASGTGTAFASFPSAAAAPGRWIYDSTNNVWRFSDGSSWLAVAKEFLASAYFPAGITPASAITTTIWNTIKPGLLKQINALIVTPGTGAGTFTVDVYDVSGTTQLCVTGTQACNASAGSSLSVNCSVAMTAGNQFSIRVNDSGCTTGPALNLNALVIGG